VTQSCSPRDRGLALETASDRFFCGLGLGLDTAGLGRGLGLEVSVMNYFQDHPCICRTHFIGSLACFCQLLTCLFQLQLWYLLQLVATENLSFLGGYCFELCTCVRFFETVFGGPCLEGAGLGLGLGTAGLGLGLGTYSLQRASQYTKESRLAVHIS